MNAEAQDDAQRIKSEQALQELVDECQRLGLYDITNPTVTDSTESTEPSNSTGS